MSRKAYLGFTVQMVQLTDALKGMKAAAKAKDFKTFQLYQRRFALLSDQYHIECWQLFNKL